MSKVRVYEAARELGMSNKDLVALLRSLGCSEVRNHMSAVEAESVERAKRKIAGDKGEQPKAVEERVTRGVIKRRSQAEARKVVRAEPASAAVPVAPRAIPSPPPSAPPAEPGPAPAEPEPTSSATGVEAPAVVEAAPCEPAPPEPVFEPVPIEAVAPEPVATAAVEEPAPPAAPTITVPEQPEPAVAPPEPIAVPTPATAPVPEVAAPAPLPMVASPLGAGPPATGPALPDLEGVRRPSTPPKSGIEVWEGRPGVPMPQRPRAASGARRTTYDPRAAAGTARPGYGGRAVAGRPMRPGFRRGPGFTRDRRRGPVEVSTKEMSAHKMVIKIEGETSVQAMAQKMSMKATEVLMKLLGMGMTGVHINSTLDVDTAKLVASEFGWTLEDVSLHEDEELEHATQLEGEDVGDWHPRPPIVTVMGHVDHGKTTLLDTIRKAQVAAGEAGGITQHIGAYLVERRGSTICFLDTPGHEAFTAMRARGAQLTDIVVLVCAADDGVMPQTREAIAHARDADVPIIVAVNKIDKPGVDPDRVMRDLSSEGLTPEQWGGETIVCKVSAKTGEGIEQLLEMIQLQADMLELHAWPRKRATGVVIEALLDRGRGPVARVLIQDGTLERGDVLLAGCAYGKIRAMTDQKGRKLKEAGPSTPVEVLGLNEVPQAGDPAHAVKDLKAAEALADERRKRVRKATTRSDARMSLGDLARRLEEAERLELKVIIKADVQGSVEALVQAFQKLSTKKVGLAVVHTGVGGITETDVNLAVASDAIIIGFNVRPAGKSKKLAEHEGVEIRLYSIIYEAIDDVRSAMEGLLPATKIDKDLGKAEVRQVFRISKVGTIAGCMALEGVIRRSAEARLVRESVVIWSGKIGGLKRFKDDVREVREGVECGISLEGYGDLKEGDIIEVFEVEEIKAKLED